MTKGEKNRGTRKKNVARRTQWCLRKIRKHSPKNLLETSQLGMRLVRVGSGAFRTAYKIAGTTLLIKFPIMESFRRGKDGVLFPYHKYDADGKYHTRAEVRKIRALSEFKSLHKHLPPVYYYNSADGVMVTQYFNKASEDDLICGMGPLLSGVIKELTGVTLEDLFGDNMRIDPDKSRLVFTDLGY